MEGNETIVEEIQESIEESVEEEVVKDIVTQDEKAKIEKNPEFLEDLYKLGKKILDDLLKDQIQATPKNYQIYFDRLLDNYSFGASFKKHALVDDEQAKKQANMEKEVKRGFISIKNMLQIIMLVYKNLTTMERMVANDITKVNKANAFEIKDVIEDFESELKELNQLLNKHLEILRTSYEDVSMAFKSISDQSIYDSKYGVFNKNYLISAINNQLANVKEFGYDTVLMLIRVRRGCIEEVQNIKQKQSILKFLAAKLLETSRRSDFVAHFERESFAILMQHTNLENAKKAQDRIAKVLYNMKFPDFDEEKLELEFALSELKQDLSAEEIISSALDRLEWTRQEVLDFKKSVK